ncbi:hypothetical protein P7C73_g6037, partial [Tremellales sp. Uapishka_1]
MRLCVSEFLWYAMLIDADQIKVASHLSLIDTSSSQSHSMETLTTLMHLHPTPLSFFERELQRTRPRHYVLFTLEPLFILLSPLSASLPPHITVYVEQLLQFARSVKRGEIERDLEEDVRYFAKLAWFERMWSRWRGEKVVEAEPEGKGWQGGWNQSARLDWGFI